MAQPIEGLGDEFTPLAVAVQQGAHSAVDDVAIEGISPGGRRILRVACRRRPTIGKSDESTVKLFADFLDALASHPIPHTSDRARLGLAVSAPFGPASELAILTEIARRQPDHASFITAVNAQGAQASQVRVRLQNVVDLVEAAETYRGNPSQGEDRIAHLAWQLLQALFVIELQLEGDVAPGRTNLVARLTTLTADAARAEDLRLRLLSIAGASEIRAGAYTRPMLRRDLRSFGLLAEAPDFIRARPQLEALESELRARTSSSLKLPGTGETFTIDRSVVVKELVQLTVNSPAGAAIIVRGEPDVGKSSVTLRAVDSLRSAGGAALVASLRDLPPAVIDLRAALGMTPEELLSAAPSSPTSALVLDGAEVIQECDCQSAGAFVRAAVATGITIILVVRDDAADSLRNHLRGVGVEEPKEFLVSPLAPEEITALAKAVPTLAQMTADARAAWLLRRIGLVDLLLRAVQLGIPMPTSLSSEAEIFSIVWSGLIRRNEAIIGGVSPDDREAAVIEVARALLTGQPTHIVGGAALPSLRSDGVLLSRKASATWEKGDRFASDVLRDFATTRLLLQGGLKVLADANAPRWTVRAARLFAQSQLAQAVLSSGGIASATWDRLRVEFGDLSANHGQRWTEVPWESLLAAGWAAKLLTELTPSLLANQSQQAELLRTAMVRFSYNGASDVTVVAPLISWLLENRGLDREWSIDDAESVRKHILRWLRGVARLEAAQLDASPCQDLRVRVREALIQCGTQDLDPDFLESLGLLGKDSSKASDQLLIVIAKDRPGFLAPVVESVDVAQVMSRYDPKLLAWLAEEYYIEKPNRDSWRGSWHDEGIRHHEGHGPALAAWYRGPFLFLLREDFARGLRLIDRMLDRGARVLLETSSTLLRQLGSDPNQQFEGLELGFADSGSRSFVGDQNVWSWYRGSSAGPYPCMSALFALEMFMDGCVRSGIDVESLTRRVIRDASTLASVGLCFGFLVRHIDKVSKELDSLLAEPAVWQLEFSRVSHEGTLHVQGGDDPSVPGRERRAWTPLNVAMYFVVGAMQRRDEQRLNELRDIGARLIQNASGESAPPTVRRWAAHLDWSNYVVVEENGQLLIKADVPEEVTEALAPITEDIERQQEMYRLLNRYRLRYATPYRFALAELPPDEELAKDVQAARQLEKFAQNESSDPVRCAVSGVAAAVLHRATRDGADQIPPASLNWARDLLVRFAVDLNRASFNHPDTMYSLGGDRQAALALPLIVAPRDGRESPTRLDSQMVTSPTGISFLQNCKEWISARVQAVLAFSRRLIKVEPRFDSQEDLPRREKQTASVLTALEACTSSTSVEVRQCVAEGLRSLFDQSCSNDRNGRCWHESVWLAIEAGARRVVLGDFSENGRADIQPITGDVVGHLRDAPDGKLMLTYIEPAAICAMDAARTATCIKPKAAALRDALTQAYARSASVWAEHNYHRHKEQDAAFGSAVLRSSLHEGPQRILEIGAMLSNSPGALADYLDALVMASTYETNFVPALSAAWPKLMEIGLLPFREPDKHEHAYRARRRLDSLMPSPRTSGYFEDPEPVRKNARTQWLPITAVSQHLEEWLRYAHGDMHAVDALVGYLQTRPLQEQIRPGLEWVHKIVIDEDRTAAACGFLLVAWLHTIRGSLVEEAPQRWYREIVDALVLGRYVGARELQALDE